MNELVTNAFKHAFPGNRKGRVEVSFTRRRDRGWRLRIADDGVGLPGWPWRDGSHGLGIRIVDALVDRLHGRLDVATDHGTRFTLDIEPQ